jgi:hypothetical protein
MDSQRRSSLAGGLVLILLGALFLAVQWVPGLQLWFSWPLIIIGIGVLLLIVGLLTGVPAMAMPACIVGGIGGLLYWQNATGNWESWAYAWTLIPGFVGVGMVLSGLLGGDTRQTVRGGGWLILISLVLFAVFASFFGALGLVGRYWPVLLIGLGLLVLAQSLFRSR